MLSRRIVKVLVIQKQVAQIMLSNALGTRVNYFVPAVKIMFSSVPAPAIPVDLVHPATVNTPVVIVLPSTLGIQTGVDLA